MEREDIRSDVALMKFMISTMSAVGEYRTGAVRVVELIVGFFETRELYQVPVRIRVFDISSSLVLARP